MTTPIMPGMQGPECVSRHGVAVGVRTGHLCHAAGFRNAAAGSGIYCRSHRAEHAHDRLPFYPEHPDAEPRTSRRQPRSLT